MNKRTVRRLIASAVAVVAIGAGVSTAALDDTNQDDQIEDARGKPDGKGGGGKTGKGIRW